MPAAVRHVNLQRVDAETNTEQRLFGVKYAGGLPKDANLASA